MANASLAMYSESSANKADYANECLDLATMMHEQAPDDDTGWLVDTAQELVKRMAVEVGPENGDAKVDTQTRRRISRGKVNLQSTGGPQKRLTRLGKTLRRRLQH